MWTSTGTIGRDSLSIAAGWVDQVLDPCYSGQAITEGTTEAGWGAHRGEDAHMVTSMSRRFDPVNLDYLRLWVQLPPGAHLLAMLHARDFAMAAIRSRVRRLYPDLAPDVVGLKILEEIDRAERAYTRS